MKPGDYIESINALVIREVSFKDLCDKHDDLLLEYDVDDLWEAYQERGPCFETLQSEELIIVWEKEGIEIASKER